MNGPPTLKTPTLPRKEGDLKRAPTHSERVPYPYLTLGSATLKSEWPGIVYFSL